MSDRRAPAGRRAPAPLRALARGTEPVDQHPHITTARALARAWRRTGAAPQAVALALRVQSPGGTLVRWVAALALFEGAVAAAEIPDAAATSLWRQARTHLATAHPPAARFHVELASLGPAPPSSA